MPTKAGKSVISATNVRATKKIVGNINPIADDCGCVKDQGCCQNKGCCKEGHCPAESSLDLGCGGDDFSIKIRDHGELVSNYIAENKQSVIRYLNSKGVNIR